MMLCCDVVCEKRKEKMLITKKETNYTPQGHIPSDLNASVISQEGQYKTNTIV